MNLVKVTYKEEIEEVEDVDVEVEVKIGVDVVAEAKVILLWCKIFDVDKNVLMME